MNLTLIDLDRVEGSGEHSAGRERDSAGRVSPVLALRACLIWKGRSTAYCGDLRVAKPLALFTSSLDPQVYVETYVVLDVLNATTPSHETARSRWLT